MHTACSTGTPVHFIMQAESEQSLAVAEFSSWLALCLVSAQRPVIMPADFDDIEFVGLDKLLAMWLESPPDHLPRIRDELRERWIAWRRVAVEARAKELARASEIEDANLTNLTRVVTHYTALAVSAQNLIGGAS